MELAEQTKPADLQNPPFQLQIFVQWHGPKNTGRLFPYEKVHFNTMGQSMHAQKVKHNVLRI